MKLFDEKGDYISDVILSEVLFEPKGDCNLKLQLIGNKVKTSKKTIKIAKNDMSGKIVDMDKLFPKNINTGWGFFCIKLNANSKDFYFVECKENNSKTLQQILKNEIIKVEHKKL